MRWHYNSVTQIMPDKGKLTQKKASNQRALAIYRYREAPEKKEKKGPLLFFPPPPPPSLQQKRTFSLSIFGREKFCLLLSVLDHLLSGVERVRTARCPQETSFRLKKKKKGAWWDFTFLTLYKVCTAWNSILSFNISCYCSEPFPKGSI